jgi:mono/diheme cytochrome c family protein
MRRVLKWVGIVLGGLVGLALLVAVGLYVSASVRMTRTYDLQPEVVAIPSDPESIHLGERWVSNLCTECHGEDLAGTVMFEDPAIGRIVAHNLTAGEGGAGSSYTDVDWIRAIRHGIGPEGRALFVMPSEAYYYFSDRDLGAIIAYVKSVPPVDNDPGEISVTPMARLLVAAGVFVNPFAAERIDQIAPRPAAPEPGVNAEYGNYLALTFGCQACHGSDFAGGKHPEPNGPAVPSITTASNLAIWSEEDFLTAVRTRKSRFMPWESLNKLTDAELIAIWLHLQTVPPVD